MRITRRSIVTGPVAIAASFFLTKEGLAQSADDPMIAAETLSRFEVEGEVDFLCNFMHSDSLRETPRYAVNRWYRNVFLPTGPAPAASTSVRYIDWTWPVNGVTYPGTAEGTYVQAFADGSVVRDVVRLVWQDGRRCWFFGRSREFIAEQIELGRADVFPRSYESPPAWAVELALLGPEALAHLPIRFDQGVQSATFPETLRVGERFSEASEQVVVRFIDDRFTIAQASWLQLGPGVGFQVDFISQQLEYLARLPSFTVSSYDLLFRSQRPHALIRVMIDDEVGIESFHFIAGIDRTVWVLSARTDTAITELGRLLVGSEIL